MRIIHTLDEMTETARGWLTRGPVGFIIIMSSLHAGHERLIEAVHMSCDISVVALVQKPWLRTFPPPIASSNMSKDLQRLEEIGVDVLFLPRLEDLYPKDFTTYVTPIGSIVERLEGSGLFTYPIQEFATVMVKLLHLVRPDEIYFSQKDAHKVAVLRHIIRDFHIDIRLYMLLTVRDNDGLAISSQNQKLSPEERQASSVLYQALLLGKRLIEQGERRSEEIIQAMHNLLATASKIHVQAILICDPDTFSPLLQVVPGTLLAITAQIGTVDLTDNVIWLQDGRWLT